MDYETITAVQESADHFAAQLGIDKATVRINSAHRCFEYNRSIGSTDKSQHPLGRAIDYTIDGVSPADLYDYLVTKYPDKYGIGSYDSFTHIDTRSNGPARW
jgi:uncharacterized protein YcbK (DUF882 family)